MSTNKGFTLIEITVVLIIIGLVAAFTFPNFATSIEQTKAQTAKSNLLALAAAQQKYNEDYNGSYCTITTGNVIPCGDSTTDLNTYLHLGMGGTDDLFTYTCSATTETIPYNCTATDGKVSLTLDENNPIPAGNTCTGASQLPVCCTAGGGACPN